MGSPVPPIVAFYNKCGTCEHWIKEGKARSSGRDCRAERSRAPTSALRRESREPRPLWIPLPCARFRVTAIALIGKRMFGQYPVPCCDVPICVRIDQESSVQRKDRNRKYQYSKQQCRHIGRNDQIIFLHRLKSLSGLRPQPQNQCMGSLQIILVAQRNRIADHELLAARAEDDLNCRCSQPASARGLWPARPISPRRLFGYALAVL